MKGGVDQWRDDRRLHGPTEGRMNQWRAVSTNGGLRGQTEGRKKVAWTDRGPHKPMEGCGPMEGRVDRQRDDRKLHGPLEGQINQWRAVDQWRAVWTDRGTTESCMDR